MHLPSLGPLGTLRPMSTRTQQLRDQARALILQAKQEEASERAAQRKQRDRAAYVIGGWLIRHRVDQAREMISYLSERDRNIVAAVLGIPQQSQPAAKISTTGPA